jgi:4-hydroxybenzoate polyprenyltransferase
MAGAVDLRSRLKLFWALSRTPHGLLDMTTPAMAALFCLGAIPETPVALIGMLTAFAGYTAVYALNDVVDYRSDRAKAVQGLETAACADLDAVLVRHPMACGLLGFGQGLSWALGWAAVALMGAWWLNPVCAAIFVGGCLLETVYCLLWRVSPSRTLVSGAVKTMGAMAAIWAVNPSPAPLFVLLLFAALFCWEVGGQNIPNDWSDIAQDRRWGAKTIPVMLGLRRSATIIGISLAASVGLTALVAGTAPAGGPLEALAALGAGVYFLLMPALALHGHPCRENALALFNRASWFPPALLVIALAAIWV